MQKGADSRQLPVLCIHFYKRLSAAFEAVHFLVCLIEQLVCTDICILAAGVAVCEVELQIGFAVVFLNMIFKLAKRLLNLSKSFVTSNHGKLVAADPEAFSEVLE